MAYITPFSVDLIDDPIRQVVVKQYDGSIQQLLITVEQNGVEWKLNPREYVCALRMMENSKIFFTGVTIIEDGEYKGKLLVPLNRNMTDVPGDYKAEINIFDRTSTDQISSKTWILSVQESVVDNKDIIEQVNDITAITDLMSHMGSTEQKLIITEERVAAAEKLRAEEESNRVDAESKRDLAEEERLSKEEERVQNESIRVQNEDERIDNEDERERKESERIDNEEERVVAESTRLTAEEERVNNEEIRITNEKKRSDNEDERVANEEERVENEKNRVSNEEIRQNDYADIIKSYKDRAKELKEAADSIDVLAGFVKDEDGAISFEGSRLVDSNFLPVQRDSAISMVDITNSVIPGSNLIINTAGNRISISGDLGDMEEEANIRIGSVKAYNGNIIIYGIKDFTGYMNLYHSVYFTFGNNDTKFYADELSYTKQYESEDENAIVENVIMHIKNGFNGNIEFKLEGICNNSVNSLDLYSSKNFYLLDYSNETFYVQSDINTEEFGEDDILITEEELGKIPVSIGEILYLQIWSDDINRLNGLDFELRHNLNNSVERYRLSTDGDYLKYECMEDGILTLGIDFGYYVGSGYFKVTASKDMILPAYISPASNIGTLNKELLPKDMLYLEDIKIDGTSVVKNDEVKLVTPDIVKAGLKKQRWNDNDKTEILENLDLVYKSGDILNCVWYGSGYVTGSGRVFVFTLPLSKPISKNVSGVIVEYNDGVILRQSENYLYGTGDPMVDSVTYIKPPLIKAAEDASDDIKISEMGHINIRIAYDKDTTTRDPNVVNNSPVGIIASLKITFQ